MVLELFRKGKSAREADERRGRNAAILDDAMGQRAKVHVTFDETESSLKGVTASILEVHAEELVLELGGLSNLKDRFVGRRITCFFKVIARNERNREIFYTFDAPILAIRQAAGALPHVTVAFPDFLQGAQRRKSLRLRPDLDRFDHIALWRYDVAGNFNPARPVVAHSQFKASLAVLENISAGGMRLLLHRALLKEMALDPKNGERCILYFSLAAPPEKLRNEFWFIGRINNIVVDPVSRDMTLGLEFYADGVRQAETGKITWNKVTDNVVDDLAQHIYQWHLALYRDKGLAG
jgi:c-di-GMP-binding flagellar brake protein YcgR